MPDTERLPDRVMLDDFARHIELARDSATETTTEAKAHLWEFMGFMDQNAERLLLLATTCVDALERQSKEPT